MLKFELQRPKAGETEPLFFYLPKTVMESLRIIL